jgi:hypothetical protein
MSERQGPTEEILYTLTRADRQGEKESGPLAFAAKSGGPAGIPRRFNISTILKC